MFFGGNFKLLVFIYLLFINLNSHTNKLQTSNHTTVELNYHNEITKDNTGQRRKHFFIENT